MKNTHKIAVTLWLMIVATAGLYAAGQQITSLTQTVWEGDIMTAAYYNKLNGPKSEGKVCKFVTDKMVCLDDMPTWGGGTTQPGETIMRKTVYKSSDSDNPDQNVVEWNTLVSETDQKVREFAGPNPDSQAVNEWERWVNTCTIESWKYGINDFSTDKIERCWSLICRWKGHPNPTMSIVHCWEGSPLCPKWVFDITCMY